MKPKATRETLERLAEAVDKWAAASAYFDGKNEVSDMLRAYRAELRPPLRTRAEVDAEIATVIRDYHRHITRPGWKEQPDWDSFSVGIKSDLHRLCAEPTREPEAECKVPASDWQELGALVGKLQGHVIRLPVRERSPELGDIIRAMLKVLK